MSSLASHLRLPPSPRGEADRDRALLITHLVAFSTGVSAREIAASGRAAVAASDARHLAMFLARSVALSR